MPVQSDLWEVPVEILEAQAEEIAPRSNVDAVSLMESCYRAHPEWDVRLPSVWAQAFYNMKYIREIDCIPTARAKLKEVENEYYSAMRLIAEASKPLPFTVPAFSETQLGHSLQSRLRELIERRQWHCKGGKRCCEIKKEHFRKYPFGPGPGKLQTLKQ